MDIGQEVGQKAHPRLVVNSATLRRTSAFRKFAQANKLSISKLILDAHVIPFEPSKVASI
jgi:hypothetical protein